MGGREGERERGMKGGRNLCMEGRKNTKIGKRDEGRKGGTMIGFSRDTVHF